jgi:hypothetical protein
MTSVRTTRRALPGWLVGVLAATGSLVALGFVTLGFFVSGGGLVIASALAIAIGTVAAALADPARALRHTAVVAFYVVALAVGYVLVLQNLARLAPGVTSGAGVERPERRGGPGVDPPPR